MSNELTQFHFYLVGNDVSNLGGSFASRAFDVDPSKAGKKRVFSQLNAVEWWTSVKVIEEISHALEEETSWNWILNFQDVSETFFQILEVFGPT